MNSMTGFGRGEARNEQLSISVELSGVNRKQTEIAVNLPRGLSELETVVRQVISDRISRGRVGVSVSLEKTGAGDDSLSLNQEKALVYTRLFKQLGKLASQEGIEIPTPTIRDYMNIPDILSGNNTDWDIPVVQELLLEAINAALDGFVAMRKNEGDNIKEDILLRLSELEKTALSMKEQAPLVVARFRENLHRRLNEAGIPLDLNDDRLIKELGMFAERCDIAEEFTRLMSHFAQFRQKCDSNEPAGRPLDFLCQEIFREFNTIGSKANDASLAHCVVASKTELEKIREQIQNIE